MVRGQLAELPTPESRPLDAMPAAAWVRVTAFLVDPGLREWLEAMGLGLGEELMILRRAPFGGPLHVRIAEGAEFAVDREVAARIEVAPVGPRSAP